MRVCSGAGCLRAVPDDVHYCDGCKPPVSASGDIREHTLSYAAELDATQGHTLAAGPQPQVRRCPLCARCERRITEIADHVVPAPIAVQQARDSGRYPLGRNAGYDFLSSLQGLCRPRHALKTEEDKTHVGHWPDVVDAED